MSGKKSDLFRKNRTTPDHWFTRTCPENMGLAVLTSTCIWESNVKKQTIRSCKSLGDQLKPGYSTCLLVRWRFKSFSIVCYVLWCGTLDGMDCQWTKLVSVFYQYWSVFPNCYIVKTFGYSAIISAALLLKFLRKILNNRWIFLAHKNTGSIRSKIQSCIDIL